MTVMTPPPPVAFDVASDVFFNSGAVEPSLGWTIAVVVDDGTVTVTAPPFGIAFAVEEPSIVNLAAGDVVPSLVGAALSLVVEANTAGLLPIVLSSCTDPGTPTTAEDVVV